MFEKHQVELKEEVVDLSVLIKDVVGSMKLQFEKVQGTGKCANTGRPV